MTKVAVPVRLAGTSLRPDASGAGESDPDEHASFNICDGPVLVFHRADSPSRFSLWHTAEGQQIQQSLRTADRAVAAKRAAKAFMESRSFA